MKLTILRHAETNFNLEKRYLGELDPPLHEIGIAHAKELRAALSQRFDVLVSSPLLRARQTAQIINLDSRVQLVVMPEFRERSVGVFEGLTKEEARSRFPLLWKKNVTRLWSDAPTGGETIASVATRVRAGLTSLATQDPRGSVLIVAHGFVAKVVRALCGTGFHDFFEWQLPNGSSISFDIGNPQDLLPIPLDSPFSAA